MCHKNQKSIADKDDSSGNIFQTDLSLSINKLNHVASSRICMNLQQSRAPFMDRSVFRSFT